MASNTRALFDEDGESSDWIEVRNVGPTMVNLAGWALTDKAANPGPWLFPATNLNVDAYLVIFASGKNRRTPGAPLHTDFKLSSNGEYLALVEPDRSTVATEFAPYPGQVPNVSFGFGLISSNFTLVAPGAAARYLVPGPANGGDTLAETWRGANAAFADDLWPTAISGLGFSSGTSPSLVVSTSLVVRFSFDAAPVANVIVDSKPSGALRNGVSSGAAWVPASADSSPVPIARSGVMQFSAAGGSKITLAANPDFNSSQGTISFWMRSPGAMGPQNSGATLVDRRVVSGALLAQGGTLLQDEAGHILVQTFSNGVPANALTSVASSSDDRWHHLACVYDQAATGFIAIYFDGVLDNARTNGRSWTWPSGQAIELGRSHDAGFRAYTGLMDDFRIYKRALTAEEIGQVYSGDGGVPAADIRTDLEAEMLGVNSSVLVRVPFVVENPAAFSLLTLRVKYDDGYVAWINGQRVAAAQEPDALEWNSAAASRHASAFADSVVLGNVAGLLKAGTNILALQGLNVAVDDPTFLVSPELLATSQPVTSALPLFFTRPTPGAANLGGNTNAGPLIAEVQHTPNVPKDNDDLLVLAAVSASFNAISNVTLRYRIAFNAEVSVPMNDSGTNGDLAAGDGFWSGVIPASASTNGQMIRYYISARDGLGNPSRWPLFQSALSSPEFLGTVVEPDRVTSPLPVYHLFVQKPSAAEDDTGTRASFYYDGEFYDNIGLQFRGNSSAVFLKKAHRLEFNREHRLRHRDGYARIGDTSLLGEFADPAYFRQMLSFELLNAFGTPAPFNYPVRVQLNGDFWQLAFHSDVMGPEQLQRLGYDPEGALYKAVGIVTPDFTSTGGFEKKSRLYEDRSDYLALANGINEARPLGARTTNVFDMLDVPNVINYLVISRFSQEADDVWANMTLYRDTRGDRLWRVIPFDMNVSWGQLYCGDNAGAYSLILSTNDNFKSHPFYGGSQVTGGNGNWNRLCDAIYQVPATRQMLLRRMRSFMDEFVQPPDSHPLTYKLERRIHSFTNQIWAEAFLDRHKWGWPQGQGPYCFGLNQWLTNHVDDIINQFIVPHRRHWYVTHSITNAAKPLGVSPTSNAGIPLSQPDEAFIQMAGLDYNPASGNQAEEYLCLTNGNPYAVDVSGWKLSAGIDFTFKAGTVIPSNSLLYVARDIASFRQRISAPRGNMALFVVGPYQGQLSARGESLLLTDQHGRSVSTNRYPGNPSVPQQFLRITEIMYHPSPSASYAGNEDDFEYIELKNLSANTTISLAGVRFVNGVEFDFTTGAVTSLLPGGRVLVVKNQAAFIARYGAAEAIAGPYTGSLDNGGERLQLLDASNEEIHDFSYDAAWYPITDGAGFSLVIANENTDPTGWGRRESWVPSGVVNGNPGQANPPAPVLAPILINEVVSRPAAGGVDLVELLNPTGGDVNIGGWFLTDDFGTPLKYRIPDNTIIPAGGYLVFDEAQFNTPTNAPTSFAFSARGDEVYLFSGDAHTNLSGYVFGYQFGAAESGVSFGRYTNSIGQVQFVAQSSRTPHTSNAPPKVGPVVLSEIHFHPPERPDGGNNVLDEFIELQNITGQAVPLFLVAAPTNTWRLRGGVDFDFPGGVTLDANRFLLLVNFDASNAVLQAEFRTRHGVRPEVPIFGPYGGSLDNQSAHLKLSKADLPDPSGLAYVLVDEVEYSDSAPWPAGADGTGASLQRLQASQYGNDPINWAAAAPSPGAGYGGGTPPSITRQLADVSSLVYSDALLSVTVTGTAPLWFQWRRNGVNIPGATEPTLPLPDLEPERAGSYQVVIFNGAGVTFSSNATLNVALPAAILAQPQSQNILVGSNVTFRVQGFSYSNLRYQWRLNGKSLLDATNSMLTLTQIDLADEGIYTVAITDDLGTQVSAPAKLTPLIKPAIVEQPGSLTVGLGDSASFRVAASGYPYPFGYRWRRGSTLISFASANQSSYGLTIPKVGLNHAGTWTVSVTNQANPSPGAVSSNFFVTVVTPPTNQVVNAGEDATFTVSANGSAPVYYQWQFKGANITEATTNSTLVIPAVQPPSQGLYSVVVTVQTNPVPAPATFSAFLSLAGAPTITEQPASQLLAAGTRAVFQVKAVSDTPVTYQWRFNGHDLPGQIDSSLVLNSVDSSDEGAYTVLLMNSVGSALSRPAVLTLLGPPELLSPQILRDGRFQMLLRANAPQNLLIEFSGNLTNWTSLGTVSYTNGNQPVIDAAPFSPLRRFYRARRAP